MCVSFALCLLITSNATKYKPDQSLYVKYDLSKDLLPEPEQIKVDAEPFTVKENGINITIKKLASYDITGKVEDIKDFSSNPLANFFSFTSDNFTNYISPRDLALSWGNLSLDENKDFISADQYFFNGDRRVLFSWSSELISKYGEEYTRKHCSNNHVIALDSGLKKELLRIKEYDVVRIVGYLVDCRADNGWSWGPSSLSREDTGCEIIRAEEILILNR